MNKLIFILLIANFYVFAYGQIIVPGKHKSDIIPKGIIISKSYADMKLSKGKALIKNDNKIPVIELAKITDKMLKQYLDTINGDVFAYPLKVNYKIKQISKCYESTDGRNYLVSIYSKGAKSINVIFSKFHLPIGAELYIYSKDNKEVIGALTARNNKESGKLAVKPIAGDEIIIEYFEPFGKEDSTLLVLGAINHAYKTEYLSDFGESSPVNIDINCVEGNNWQNEKRSVVRILISGTTKCSGSLVNNARNNGKGYILTAGHCYSTSGFPEESVFFFNYESPYCKGPDGQLTQTVSGASKKANSDTLDFMFMELSEPIPSDYKPFYAGVNGQNSSDVIKYKATGIHHPKADVKKISIDDNNIYKSGWNGDPIQQMYWAVWWTKGAAQPGSSGSPLFDRKKKIIGVLSSGGSIYDCLYARMDLIWDYYSDPLHQLKHWLDPDITGIRNIPSYTNDNELTLGIICEKDTIGLQRIVTFYNSSFGQGSNYRWDFGYGAVPSSATGTGPFTVKYITTGDKNIMLDGTDNKGIDRNVFVKNYINVSYEIPSTDFTISRSVINEGDTLTVKDNSGNYPTGFNWSFGFNNNAVPSSANGPGPHVVKFLQPGTQAIKLTASNPEGSKDENKYITVNYVKPIPGIKTDVKYVMLNTGYVKFKPNCNYTVTEYTWDFGDGAQPQTAVRDFYDSVSVRYFTPGDKTIKLIASNPAGKDSIILENFIHVIPSEPIAGFTLSSPGVQEKDSIIIYNNSSGYIENYYWDFGTGSIPRYANGVGPHIVQYTVAGLFTIKLKVTNSVASDSATKTINVSYLQPIADFYANNTNPRKNDTIIFIDNSQNTITTYNWDFGSGAVPSSAFGQGPHKVKYSDVGGKTVSLRVANPGGNNTKTKVNYITVDYAIPDATIDAYPQSITKNGYVNFSATGINNPVSYAWNFGSGASPVTSSSTNQIVQYNSAGSKTVTLTVTNTAGSKTIIKNNLVIVSEALPVANFTSNKTICFQGDTVIFSDNTQNNPSSWQWDFGGGAIPTTVTGIGPHKVFYTTTGYKTISLVATNATGSDTEIKNSMILVNLVPPVAGIQVPNGIIENEPFIVSDSSKGTISSYLWNFGTGASPSSGSGIGPYQVKYSSPGQKTISLKVTNSSGQDTEQKMVNVSYAPPLADFTADRNLIVPGSIVEYNATCNCTIENYLWQFGAACDPASATGPGPHFVQYNSAGTFDVSLMVSNPAGSDTIEKKDFITAYLIPPVAGFTVSDNEKIVKDTITFYDNSAGPVDAYYWNFGDGAIPSSATGAGPHKVIYNKKGFKNIKQVVKNAIASDTLYIEYFMYVNPLTPVADFDIISKRENGKYYALDSILFIDRSENEPVSYNWDFSPWATPSVSYDKGPTYVIFYEAGSYKVRLDVSNEEGGDYKEKSIDIEPAIPTDIENTKILNPEISLMPNPAKDKVYIITDKPSVLKHISLYDIAGKQLNCNQKNNLIEFKLQKGLYIVNVNGVKLKLIVL